MADCTNSTNCGCSLTVQDPPVPTPAVPQTCPPQAAPGAPQPPVCPSACGCGSGSGGSGGGKTGNASFDQGQNRARQVGMLGQPNIPSIQAHSPGINVSSGNLYLVVSVVGGGPYGTRNGFTYNSQAANQASLYGAGVASFYNQTITKIDDDNIELIKGNGAARTYTDRDSGTNFYLAPAGTGHSLKRVSGGWIETQPDGLQFKYDDVDSGAFGRLDSITDLGGQIWTMTYDGTSGALTKITDPFNRLTTYGYDGSGNLQRIVDYTGRVTTFTVDGSGNLTEILTPELCSTQLVYDGNHLLTAYVDPAGNRTSYTYDGNERVTSVQTPLNELTTFNYVSDSILTATDPRNNVTTVSFDGDRNITAVANPLGQVTSYTWGDDYLTAITDANGQTTTLVYSSDLDSRITPLQAIQYPDGGRFTYQYDNTNNRLAALVDELGHCTTMVWDGGTGLRSAIVDALGQRTSYSYNTRKQVATITNPLGLVTTYGYDSFGNLSTVQSPLGQVTTLGYNGYEQQITIQDPLGNVSTTVYDLMNRPLAVVDPLGHRTSYSYDSNCLPQSVTSPLGEITTTLYDADRRAIATIDPNGHTTTFSYDAIGNRITSQNSLGQVTTLGYDVANRLTSQTDPLGNTASFGYDSAGNQVALTDALGFVTTSAYDPVNRLKLVEDPLGYVTTFSYDLAGNLTTSQNALGNVTTSVYDALNRPSAVVSPLGERTTTTYDAAGRRTAVMNPLGELTTTSYDVANRPIALTDGEGHVTTTSYDLANRLTAVQNALGYVTTNVYDVANRRTALVNANGGRWTFTLDADGRTTQETDPLGRVTTLSYDAAGRLTSKLDARGVMTTFVYDNADRPTARVYSRDANVDLGYDAAGNSTLVRNVASLTTITYDALNRPVTEYLYPGADPRVRGRYVFYNNSSFDGVSDDNAIAPDKQALLPGGTGSGVNATSYDKGINGIMVDLDSLPGTVTASDFTFKVGNTSTPGSWSTATAPSSVTTRSGAGKNGSDRITIIWSDGTLTNEWLQVTVLANGNTGLTTADVFYFGNCIADTDGNLATNLQDKLNINNNFGASGQPITSPYDVDRSGSVDLQDKLDVNSYLGTSIIHLVAPATLLRTLSYQYDPRGLRSALTDSDAGTFTYTYDQLGRLDHLLNPQGELTTFSYDADNRQTLKKLANSARTSFTYDAAGRISQLYHLKSDNSVLDGLAYAYDHAGHRTSVLESSGDRVTWTYDATYQLTNEKRSGATAYNLTHTYDGVGNRLVKNDGGSLSTFTYDTANQLQTDVDNTGVTTYTFDAAGNQQLVVAPSNSRTTSTWDDENRPTKVVLPAGTITTNAYRADGLRYQRQDSGGTTVFVYDGQNYLLETDGSNVTQAVYTNEPQGYGNLVNQRRKSGMSWTASYALFDALGSTRKLTDASQNISDTYTYDAFGSQRATSGSTVNPFRYVGAIGYFYDPDTGTMNVRARTYQPGISRWWSQDPIGFAGGDDDLFSYVGNSPTNVIDPTGLIAPGPIFVDRGHIHHNYQHVPTPQDICISWYGLDTPQEKDMFDHWARYTGTPYTLPAIDVRNIIRNVPIIRNSIEYQRFLCNNGLDGSDTITGIFKAPPPYVKGLGTAAYTITTLCSGGTFCYSVTITDTYDFDPQPWGNRSFSGELDTRLVNFFGRGKDYPVSGSYRECENLCKPAH